MNTDVRALSRPLLFLVLFNLIPQVQLRPLWTTVLAFALVGFRLWLDFKGRKMPPRWTVWLVQIGVAMVIWQHFHSFFGDEAGGAFLTLLTCVKTYELNRKRDLFLTCLLCVLVLMSYLLLDQGLMITAFLLVDLLAIIGFLYALEEGRWSLASNKKLLRSSLALALKSLPLVVLMFVLFPRFNTGFGHNGNVSAKTGVGDTLHPGSVGNLIQSEELVFRATFLEGYIPARSQLYWRGAVLDKSSGMNWERSNSEVHKFQPAIAPQKPDIEVYLEPGNEKFLFSLENTRNLAFPNESTANRISPRDGSTYELAEPLQTRERYYIEQSDTNIPESQDPEHFLSVQEKPSQELQKFLIKYDGKPANQTVRELLTHFRSDGFKYSLKPPLSANMDEFLFKNKVGFCEHFAGSMATILRDLKIPARVVVGFQGGTPSFFQNYISVRGHDAHAWVEYFDKSTARWRRVDPTAEVEPERVSMGGELYYVEGRTPMPAWIPGGWLRGYLRGRAFVDEVEAAWTGFLLRFDSARQKELLTKLGMEEVMFRALAVFLLLSIGLILAVLYFLEAQRREPLSVDEQIYRRLLVMLKKWRIDKSPNEGPWTLMLKIRSLHPRLAQEVEPILGPLIHARFGRAQMSQQLAALLWQRLGKLRKFRI